MEYTVLEKAIRFAVDAHAGQTRKDGAPFILHPMEDAAIVGTLTDDLDVIAAAVLHDTVEDTDTTPQDILDAFGPRVYDLVMGETENKRPALPPSQTWKVRKTESLQLLEAAKDPAVRILWLGDKLSNLRALHRAFKVSGTEASRRFHVREPQAHKWYYGEILRLLQPLADTAAYREYQTLYHAIFDGYEGE